MIFYRTKQNRLPAWFCGLIFMVSCFTASSVFAGKRLKIQSVVPRTSNYFVEMEKFAVTVKNQTDGEIRMTIFPPGALVKPLECFDAVKRGAIEGSLNTGSYAVKKIPEGLIEHSVPMSFSGKRFTAEAAEQYYEFMYNWRGGKVFKMIQELYAKHKIYLVGESVASSYGFMTSFPVRSLDDMRGKKYRSFGLYAVMVKYLGASPASISNSEQYLALQRKTVDGTIYTYSSLDTYNLNEVITYAIFPPALQTPAVNLILNMRTWRSFSKKNQKIIIDAYRKHAKAFSYVAIEDEKRALQAGKTSGKIKLVDLNPEDIKKFKAAGRKSWSIAEKKSKKSAELLKLLKEYLNEKGLY